MTELNAYGTNLIYSTFIGGTDRDYGYGVSVDSSRCAFVTGSTRSVDFPVTTSTFQNYYSGGNYDVFLTKIDIPLCIYSIDCNDYTATIFWNSLPGKSYIVEWSEDMSSWTQIPVGQVGEWTDMEATGHAEKFYRVREE